MNLSLLVGPLRPDGYHELFTVFAPLDLYDELECQLAPVPADQSVQAAVDIEVDCPGVPPQGNLISRAFELLAEATGWGFRGRVKVAKSIPVGAGLGGGSSDAACALRLAAEVLAVGGGPMLDGPTLAEIALRLGADVPFFLDPRPALATGVGEILAPLPLPPLPLVVVLPEEPLLTAEVYRTYDRVAGEESFEAWEGRRQMAEHSWRSLAAAWSSSQLDLAAARRQVAGLLHNDLQRAAFHILPGLAARAGRLQREGVLGVLVSGSGPTLFGVCAGAAEAERVVLALNREGLRAKSCQAGLP